MSGLEQGLGLDQFKHTLLIFSAAKNSNKNTREKNTKNANFCSVLFCSVKNNTNAEAAEGLADYSDSLCHLQSQLRSKNYSVGKGKESRDVRL